MPVHDRSAMTFDLSRGQLIGRPDLTAPLEAERAMGCPSGHIAAPLTSAIRHPRGRTQNAGAEARVPDASEQHRTARMERPEDVASLRPHDTGCLAVETAAIVIYDPL